MAVPTVNDGKHKALWD